MSIILKTICAAILFSAASYVNATPSFQSCPGTAYFNLEGGASFARDVDPNPPLPWDPSPSGYKSGLGNSEVIGAGLGYILTPALRAEVTVDHRNSFQYEKFQTSPAVFGSKTRYFDLKNTTIMANLFVDGSGVSDNLVFKSCYFSVDPFIEAGIGNSFNTVDNLHSVKASNGKTFSMMQAHTQNSFAYQVGAGFTIKTCSRLALGIGYRYLDGGQFSSNNYLIDNPDNEGVTGGTVYPAWKGRLKTNEVYASLHYNFG